MVKASQLGMLLKSVGKISPQLESGKFITKESVKIGQTVSNDVFGYDFVGLGIKLIVYFTIAFVFAKFMEGIIFARGIWVTAASLFGFNIPNAEQVPDGLKKLFDDGLGGFKFWDIVKIVAILLVTAEFIRYTNTNRKLGSKSSPMTIGIFVLLIAALSITTVPELLKRIRQTDFNLEQLR